MKKVKYIKNGVAYTFTKEQVTNEVLRIEQLLKDFNSWVDITVLLDKSKLDLKYLKKILLILGDKISLKYGEGEIRNYTTLYGVKKVIIN